MMLLYRDSVQFQVKESDNSKHQIPVTKSNQKFYRTTNCMSLLE